MFTLNIISVKALRKNSRYFKFYHLKKEKKKIIEGNILINAFPGFPPALHSFFA